VTAAHDSERTLMHLCRFLSVIDLKNVSFVAFQRPKSLHFWLNVKRMPGFQNHDNGHWVIHSMMRQHLLLDVPMYYRKRTEMQD